VFGENFGDVVDGSVTIEINGEDAILGGYPSCVFGVAVCIDVKTS
jgi:hypothetical protein